MDDESSVVSTTLEVVPTPGKVCLRGERVTEESQEIATVRSITYSVTLEEVLGLPMGFVVSTR